jgi:hypothetical protein
MSTELVIFHHPSVKSCLVLVYSALLLLLFSGEVWDGKKTMFVGIMDGVL